MDGLGVDTARVSAATLGGSRTAHGLHRVGCGSGIRQIATPEIVLQRDLGEDEARIAGRGLALGAGQRVFLVGLGVQEDREVTPDGPIAPRDVPLIEPGPLSRARSHINALLEGRGVFFAASLSKRLLAFRPATYPQALCCPRLVLLPASGGKPHVIRYARVLVVFHIGPGDFDHNLPHVR